MKAVKTGFVIRNKYSTEVEYEYRGFRYLVEYPIGLNYCCEAPKLQHESTQAKIDRMIEDRNKPHEPLDWDAEMKKIFEMLEMD